VTPTVEVLKVTFVEATDHPTFCVVLHEAVIQFLIAVTFADEGVK
jgi:hypothetical protein